MSIIDTVRALIQGEQATQESAAARLRGLVERAASGKAKRSDTAEAIAEVLAEAGVSYEAFLAEVEAERLRLAAAEVAARRPEVEAEYSDANHAGREVAARHKVEARELRARHDEEAGKVQARKAAAAAALREVEEAERACGAWEERRARQRAEHQAALVELADKMPELEAEVRVLSNGQRLDPITAAHRAAAEKKLDEARRAHRALGRSDAQAHSKMLSLLASKREEQEKAKSRDAAKASNR